ncbi:hypothetical protein C8034_v011549 [Colletotrichum sidae]|uniref:Secreted protein n=1 Tax=Colletotrichum sidae TaxID=1347389 RepID=A0A4R8T0T8_9PEZI|nr:hypothetical protein C8034_v011549 [Colletotrichum sidae]
MASSLTLTTLRLAPLLSSTCTLLFAHDQHFFLTLFNRPETRKQSTNLVPTYFRLFSAKASSSSWDSSPSPPPPPSQTCTPRPRTSAQMGRMGGTLPEASCPSHT